MIESFEGKVVVVSGASRGLGKALVHAFAERHAYVGFFARDRERVRDFCDDLDQHHARYIAHAFDIQDEKAAQVFIDEVGQRFGRIDVLINNASILGPRVELAEYPTNDWREVLDVNVTGAFLLSKFAIPYLKKSEAGSIINITSSVGLRGGRNYGAYSPSKFALEGFTQSLAEELKAKGIRVNSVDPGPIATDMRREAYPSENQRKLKRTHDVLDVFYFLASEQSQRVTGQRFEAQRFHIHSPFRKVAHT